MAGCFWSESMSVGRRGPHHLSLDLGNAGCGGRAKATRSEAVFGLGRRLVTGN